MFEEVCLKYRFSPISARNVLVRDHTVAVILLRVVRPLYVRCQPDRQIPLPRHVLHRARRFYRKREIGEIGLSCLSLTHFIKLHFYADAPVPRDANTRGWMDITRTPSELLGHPWALPGARARPQTSIPASAAALWHLGPAALRVRAAGAPRQSPSSVPAFAKFLPRPRRGRALHLFPLWFCCFVGFIYFFFPNNPRGTSGGIDTLYL